MAEDDRALDELIGQMNERQQRLFACDCAEHVLHHYESLFPGDNRPRQAIHTTRRYVAGEASQTDLSLARKAVDDAVDAVGNELRQQENDPDLVRALYAVEAAENATWDISVSQAWDTATLASSDPGERQWQLNRAQDYLLDD